MLASIQTLQATISKDTNDVISAAKAAVATAGSDLTKLVQTAQNDFNAALASAQQINSSVQAQKPAANAGAQAVALDASLKDAMARAKAEVEKLQPDVTAHADTVRQAAATALNQVQGQVQTALNLAQTILLAPLQNIVAMLQNLIAHPESLANPQAIVDTTINMVTASMASTMNNITTILTKDANATLAGAQDPAALSLDEAARAKQINQAMQAASAQKSQAALNQLNALLPPVAATGVAPVTGTMAGGTTVTGTPAGNPSASSSPAGSLAGAGGHPAVAGAGARGVVRLPANRKLTMDALAKINAAGPKGQAAAAKWKASLERDWANLKKKHQAVLHPVVPAGADNSFKGYCDKLFAKLDQAQLEASRGTVITEARKRFANDPQTLAKVEKLLNQEIDRRVALLKSKPPAGPR